MLDLFSNSAAVLWLVLMVIFIIAEAAAPGLVSIWFAIGAMAALISALLHAPFWLQIIWFLVVSAVTLVATRPLAKKYINGKVQATNSDRNIGAEAIVSETIDNLKGTGAVRVDGKVWTARAVHSDDVIPEGTVCTVQDISGVKLMVIRKEDVQ